MVQKRPFFEELYDVSAKHQRVECGGQLCSFLEFPFQDVSQEPYTSGEAEGCFNKHNIESDNKLESRKIADEKGIDKTIPVSNSSSSSASSSTSEEDVRSEAQIHMLFPLPLEHYNPLRPRKTLIQPADTYSYLLGHPPLKLLPVGPDFQVDIPEWCGNAAKNEPIFSGSVEASTLFPQASDANLTGSVEDGFKFLGSCVIPMPEVDPASCNGDEVGSSRTDCCCEIPGSVSCVQQHIGEARENLRRTVGPERFLELGFGNMGEVVAENWSEEDEQLFHEVVFSNPASLDKNFWNHLVVVFPSRTNEEIVSYYFNVFMLRRRVEQNRCDRMSIDSDNDEWQESDELEEDEDSCRYENHERNLHEHDEVTKNPSFDYYEDADFLGFNGITNYSFDTTSLPSEITPEDERGDHDSQDDSCTSSDKGSTPQVRQVKVDDSKTWGSHEFVLEPCDAEVWDVGYLTCPRNEVDFLPTCSMIEEIFGVGAWNYKARDGKGLG